MPIILRIFLLMTCASFSMSSLQSFAVAETTKKPVGMQENAKAPTYTPDGLKTTVDEITSRGYTAPAGQSAQRGVSQPTVDLLLALVNARFDHLKSEVSRLETARQQTETTWASNFENLKLLLSEKNNKLEADIKALSTETSQQKELQGSFSKEVTQLSASLAAKRCESGYVSFEPHAQPSDSNGGRNHRKRVAFSSPFASVPVVAAGINHLDVGNRANTRLSTGVSSIDKTGFDLSMAEWADSHTYFSTAVWMACAN